jgi:hypothetical protein
MKESEALLATSPSSTCAMTGRALYRSLAAVLLLMALPPLPARAHCDTMDGPVVKDARQALASGDPTSALKWVHPEKEAEVREAFRHALAVRALGPEARVLADRFFLEMLVRIHREGEGAPYSGLKPAGAEIEPAIAAADQALETASVEALVKMVAAQAERGIRERFARAAEARRHMGESVGRGRDYVGAYVSFVHYVEQLHTAAGSEAGGAEHGGRHP